MYILIPVKFISFHFKCVSSGCVFSGFHGSSYPVIYESIWNHQLNFPGWPEAKSGDLQSRKTSFLTKPQIVQKNSLVLSANIGTQVKSCSKSDGDSRLFYVPSPTAPLKHSFLPALNCMTSSAETPVTLQKDQSSERNPPPVCVCVCVLPRTMRLDLKVWWKVTGAKWQSSWWWCLHFVPWTCQPLLSLSLFSETHFLTSIPLFSSFPPSVVAFIVAVLLFFFTSPDGQKGRTGLNVAHFVATLSSIDSERADEDKLGVWPDSKKASLAGAVWRFWVGVFTWVGVRTKIWVWEITGGDEGAGMLRFHYVWVCVRLMLAA